MNERTRTLPPVLKVLVDWENENGTLAAIMPHEAEALCKRLAEASVTESPRMAADALSAPSQAVTEGDSCATDSERGMRLVGPHGGLKEAMPSPTDADLNDPLFEAIWQATKTWDVNAPEYYKGYCGMNGSHVMLILAAIRALPPAPGSTMQQRLGHETGGGNET